MASRRWLASSGVLVHLALLAVPLALLGRLEAAARDWTAVLFAVLTGACVAGEVLSQAVGEDASPPGYERDRMLAAVTGIALLALFVVALFERTGGPPATEVRFGLVAGACAIGLGAALRCAAIRRLGTFFVAEARVVPDQPLVVTGVYRLLRHPSETGLLAIGLGAAALLESRAAVAVWALVLLPTSLVRVRREDAALSGAFPATHPRYASHVGALLPRLGRRLGSIS